MKKNLWVLLTVVCTGVVFLSVGALIAADAPDTIKLESPVYKKHTKAIITFAHKKHAADYKIACTECHHVYKDGKNVWKDCDEVQKCEACHSEPKKPRGDKTKMSKAEKIKKYHYDAIHANCRDCHKELKKGPTTCTKCHVK